ncbi:hypothetical protein EIP91_000312 [Steccherinum ochraceum]|uniref:Zn(2)-C6 fungal-type domain-containing protein n=1 Tax=Steccherinum ochraceum TaxID=92696 RepID=A0A4R0RPM4_9APHY|nr:hypothetical protein EIP91_000312 [Steccherinum ochraceum]
MDRPPSSHNPSSRGHGTYTAASPAMSSRQTPPPLSPRPTSLPPIHTLHPDLPSASYSSHGVRTSSGHAQSIGGYSVGGLGQESTLGTRPAPDDSDPEGDLPGPPKKKRRRQAAQPCGPCSRRGEQQKCQWHIIEPMEKYVTRGEYDELKNRFEELEAFVLRALPPLPAGTMSGIPMTAGPASEPVQGTAITPYHQSSSAANLAVYHHMMPSPRSPGRGEPPPVSVGRSSGTSRSPVSQYRPPPPHSGSSVRALPPPIPAHPVSPRQPPSPPPHPSSSSRLPPPQPQQPPKPTSRRSSLSLAAITTPYTPDNMPRSQSKNQEAQTLPWLGQRLRPALAPSGPVPVVSNCHLPPILTDLPSAAAQ